MPGENPNTNKPFFSTGSVLSQGFGGTGEELKALRTEGTEGRIFYP
jgi:hypothetical protein